MEDDYELSHLHRFAYNILTYIKYLHRKAKKEVTNQLDDIDIDPTSDINIRDIVEKEAQLTTSAENQCPSPVPLPRQCKWCHLVAKSVTNASAPTQVAPSGGQNCH